MYIKKIEVTASNLMEVVTDSSVYAIKKSSWNDEYRMVAIADADVKDVLSDKVAIIKIIE